MRLAERQKLAEEKAKAVMPPALFQIFANAISSRSAVVFDYTDRFGVSSHREEIYPEGFLEFPGSGVSPGAVYAWAYHALHRKKEQYNVLRIAGAKRLITLLDALLDMSTNAEYWAGPKPEEKVIGAFDLLREALSKLTDINEKNQMATGWLEEYQSLITIPAAESGTGEEVKFNKVYIDGIPLTYEEISKSVVACARILFDEDVLPQPLRRVIEEVQFNKENEPSDPTLPAEFDDGVIIFYGEHPIDANLVAHEAAHGFALQKWEDLFPPDDSDYSRAVDSGEPPVSEYSKRNIGEDFAESVGVYVSAPAALQKTAPLRYKAIERLMTDKEYGG